MSKIVSPFSAADEKKLMVELWDPKISEDLLKFIMFVYPWGKVGTPLEHFSGPRSWQRDEFNRVSEHIAKNKELIRKGDFPEVYQSGTASGRGVGKSAFVSMFNHWMMTCNLGSSTITTANSESQLVSKTWAELGKWQTLAINGHWFERTARSLILAEYLREPLKKQLSIDFSYYYARADLWSEERPDAFAGAHNHYGMAYLFDEASGIPKAIWSVVDGVFTEPILHRYFFAFSNPRRNTGEFYECFHKNRDYWYRRNLDSRSVEGTDVKRLNQIVEKYGEDSDEARIEVKGEFPRQGDRQFISREVVDEATQRDIEPDQHAGLVMGVDIARYGSDSTVIRFRRGRDARSIPSIKLKGKDNMEVANECAFWIDELNPDAVCIDAGNGTGVIDRLKEMGYKVFEVWFGSKAEGEEYSDLRTEMWARMRDWLKGGCIDSDTDLKDDLLGPEYIFDKQERIKLEAKESMKRRGLSSPDNGDALAVTFAIRVARTDVKARRKRDRDGSQAKDVDYNIFD